MNQLRQLDLIARNYLQVNVVLQSNVPIIVKETVSMPSEVLWSNIGGVLSLWLGVTIMTAVEFVDFMYVIISRLCNGRRKVVNLVMVESATASGHCEQIPK